MTAATPPTQTVRQARAVPVRRARRLASGLGVVLFGAFAARVLLGDFTITIPDFFRILGGAEIPGATYILMESKLPRAVLGVMVGAALGVGGAIFQTTLRNPLASPDVVGVSLGASAAAALSIIAFSLDGTAVAVAAIAGALAVAALVRLVAGYDGADRVGGQRLVLVGVGTAAALQALIQYLFTRADVHDAHVVLRWLTGSLHEADWSTLRVLGLAVLVLGPLVAWLSRSLPATELGTEAATGIGVGQRREDLLLLVGTVLVAVAVAAAGPVAFVSFLAGPIARALNAGRTTLLGAALTGAVIVVGADYVADYLLVDINFPVGVVTGALGAPFLLWLLASGRASRRTA